MFIFICFTSSHIISLISWFTFHYVYIYIPSGGTSSILRNWFTFHYVYIYISCCFQYTVSCFNIYIPLCLYLYFFNNIQCIPHSHLHSTMFIFILSWLWVIMKQLTFTFHYVYIYIRMSFGEVLFSYIYIPLCLYLYFSQCNHNQ